MCVLRVAEFRRRQVFDSFGPQPDQRWDRGERSVECDPAPEGRADLKLLVVTRSPLDVVSCLLGLAGANFMLCQELPVPATPSIPAPNPFPAQTTKNAAAPCFGAGAAPSPQTTMGVRSERPSASLHAHWNEK